MNSLDQALTSEQIRVAQLIGVDWGSTSLRVYLLGAGGQILAARSSPAGASQLGSPSEFAPTLKQVAGDWMQLKDGKIPVIACGMVGSKHGWEEVPYLATPTDVALLAQHLRAVKGGQVYLVPGLINRPAGGPPDVMRGEETQVVGALESVLRPDTDYCVVMPGTHSKWTNVVGRQIVDFATHMTGELFSVLSRHSVLGRLLPAEPAATDEAALLMALDAVRDNPQAGLSHQLFAVRSLGLTGKLSAQGLADYLSGLLIGHEILSALVWRNKTHDHAAPLMLVGEPALCQRYQLALRHVGEPAEMVLANTAAAGLWKIAQAAGLADGH